MIGRTLSHFKITAKLGEGGMGEVYQAEDTSLGREVAIKVLPEAFTQDAERLARFEREAQVLASLSHPNVAAIYEVGQVDEVHFLAIELASGEDLAARLKRGPILLEDAIAIALQIAEGLEAAHESGIVHRDLKPANVMVDSQTDSAKLLDFGLAKALEEAPRADSNLTHSPTITARMTQMGVILGTAAYMSPEQARGKAVDKRADIWAFGCILFEMLSGQQAFSGRDVTEVLASVIQGEPDWDSLQASVPVALRRLIERCLRKEPRHRLRDIGDARCELEEIRDDPPRPVLAIEGQARGGLVRTTPWVLAGLLAVVSLALGLALRWSASPAAPVRRFAIDLPWHSVPNWTDFEASLSPTGEHIVYNGRVDNRVEAYIRSLDSLEGSPVAPAQEGVSFSFSPAGDWLALLNGDLLSKVPVRGGEPIQLADLRGHSAYGISWGPNDDILISASDGLYRLFASDPKLERVTLVDEAAGEMRHSEPKHLPGGASALISVSRPEGPSQIAVVDLGSGSLDLLPIHGAMPTYSLSGHLIVLQGSTMMAVLFDLDSLSVESEPRSVLEGVSWGPWVANDGTMLYIPTREDSNARLVWTDRRGFATPVDGERRDYSHLDLASDGQTALLNVGRDIYAIEMARGTRQLLGSGALFPIFTSDNRHVTSYRRPKGIFQQLAVGGSEVGVLVEGDAGAPGSPGEPRPRGMIVPTSWNSRSGELAFFDDSSDIWVRKPDGSTQPFLNSGANERTGRFSPDGLWLAYVSDETGEYQVYATEYPGPGHKVAVSIGGGLSPIWSPDGTELFFRSGGKLMAAAVTRDPELSFGPPVELFDGPYTLDLMGHQRWDTGPGGDRFLMVQNSDDFRLVVVESWFQELERLVPTN